MTTFQFVNKGERKSRFVGAVLGSGGKWAQLPFLSTCYLFNAQLWMCIHERWTTTEYLWLAQSALQGQKAQCQAISKLYAICIFPCGTVLRLGTIKCLLVKENISLNALRSTIWKRLDVSRMHFNNAYLYSVCRDSTVAAAPTAIYIPIDRRDRTIFTASFLIARFVECDRKTPVYQFFRKYLHN